jgi:hypothetical protein
MITFRQIVSLRARMRKDGANAKSHRLGGFLFHSIEIGK